MRSRRGKLKIFFGGCAGTGKTYAMLSAAQGALKDGVDVVAGIIETHGRSETQKLLAGIPILPMTEISHKGVSLKEFSLDAAKARKPSIILVDELAHTNAPGSRHPKRWQDVEELLNAGIDVYSTLNVQHLESLNDMVAGITGIQVKETVPDAVFDTADDIALIDIPADELLKRLREGKVYLAEGARGRAAENFFKKNNIIALRELALRRTMERVDAQMNAYNIREGIQSLPVADKVLVCIGPEPLTAKLIRTARRMATSLKAPLIGLYIENLRHYRLTPDAKAAVESNLRMVERMEGKTVRLQGDNAVDEIIAYAQESGITKIIVGKPDKPRWKDILYGSLADKIIRRSGHIDVYVVTGDAPPASMLTRKSSLSVFKPKLYAASLAAIAGFTLFGYLLGTIIQPIDQALLYLIGSVFVAARLGRGPAILYALLSPACFNFFFIPPLYTLDMNDRSYWMTLLVMLASSMVITSFASRLRLQAMVSRRREHHTQMLYTLTRTLAATRGQKNMAEVTAKHISEMAAVDVTVWLADSSGHLSAVVGALPERDYVKELAVLQWCYGNQKQAGHGTTTMPSAEGLYLPLIASGDKLGVLGILASRERNFTTEEISSLETLASLLASALERAHAAEKAETSKVEAESEKLRNILLSTVSHDLRTPLATITGASSSIAADADKLAPETMRELGRSIHSEAERLSRIVTNLLDVTSLESGTIKLNLQPYFIEEVIGSALTRLENQLAGHAITTHAEPHLPMVEIDGLLIEQVLTNLLENALKYTQSDSGIEVRASLTSGKVRISVADNGPGIPEGDEQRIFDKFYTTALARAQKGTGLGLAICHGVIRAHGGDIWVRNRPEGGAVFTFTLAVAKDMQEALHEAV